MITYIDRTTSRTLKIARDSHDIVPDDRNERRYLGPSEEQVDADDIAEAERRLATERFRDYMEAREELELG